MQWMTNYSGHLSRIIYEIAPHSSTLVNYLGLLCVTVDQQHGKQNQKEKNQFSV